jgi:hypothetical protein
MVPAGSATGASVGLFERTAVNESRDRNAVWLDPGHEILAVGRSDYGHTGITCQPDTWYEVQVDIDYAAATMDVSIDGVKVVDKLQAYPKVDPNTFFVETIWSNSVGGISTAYFDDVQLY